jgi:hypothetical protein
MIRPVEETTNADFNGIASDRAARAQAYDGAITPETALHTGTYQQNRDGLKRITFILTFYVKPDIKWPELDPPTRPRHPLDLGWRRHA